MFMWHWLSQHECTRRIRILSGQSWITPSKTSTCLCSFFQMTRKLVSIKIWQRRYSTLNCPFFHLYIYRLMFLICTGFSTHPKNQVVTQHQYSVQSWDSHILFIWSGESWRWIFWNLFHIYFNCYLLFLWTLGKLYKWKRVLKFAYLIY